MSCQFPLCKSNALAGKKFCISHNKYYGTPEVKVPKEINKQSSNTMAVNKELKKLYPMFLAKHRACKIKSPDCTKVATCVHHVKGRGKNEILDQGTWVASCAPCNSWVESHHAEAEQMGFKISRHKKEEVS